LDAEIPRTLSFQHAGLMFGAFSFYAAWPPPGCALTHAVSSAREYRISFPFIFRQGGPTPLFRQVRSVSVFVPRKAATNLSSRLWAVASGSHRSAAVSRVSMVSRLLPGAEHTSTNRPAFLKCFG